MAVSLKDQIKGLSLIRRGIAQRIINATAAEHGALAAQWEKRLEEIDAAVKTLSLFEPFEAELREWLKERLRR